MGLVNKQQANICQLFHSKYGPTIWDGKYKTYSPLQSMTMMGL